MISIIIPACNEAQTIGNLVTYLKQHSGAEAEIMVADAGSSDDTCRIASEAGAKAVVCPVRGRAAQMNYGAAQARGKTLYFVHADTFPPASFIEDIKNAIRTGYPIGRYRTCFDSYNWLLKANAFFTRFDLFVCYGGDQTLFITRSLFDELQGFDETMQIMEDYDIVKRAKRKARYKIFPKAALVSARKYDTNSWWRVQRANYTIVQMYKKGATQEAMVNTYKEMLNYR